MLIFIIAPGELMHRTNLPQQPPLLHQSAVHSWRRLVGGRGVVTGVIGVMGMGEIRLLLEILPASRHVCTVGGGGGDAPVGV